MPSDGSPFFQNFLWRGQGPLLIPVTNRSGKMTKLLMKLVWVITRACCCHQSATRSTTSVLPLPRWGFLPSQLNTLEECQSVKNKNLPSQMFCGKAWYKVQRLLQYLKEFNSLWDPNSLYAEVHIRLRFESHQRVPCLLNVKRT